MDVTTCQVHVDTFAEQPVFAPVRLLFVAGKLVQVMLDIESKELTDQWKVIEALSALYGTTPARRSKSREFYEHVWTAGGHRLSCLVEANATDPFKLQIILRDTARFDAAAKLIEYNGNQIRAAMRANRASDTR